MRRRGGEGTVEERVSRDCGEGGEIRRRRRGGESKADEGGEATAEIVRGNRQGGRAGAAASARAACSGACGRVVSTAAVVTEARGGGGGGGTGSDSSLEGDGRRFGRCRRRRARRPTIEPPALDCPARPGPTRPAYISSSASRGLRGHGVGTSQVARRCGANSVQFIPVCMRTARYTFSPRASEFGDGGHNSEPDDDGATRADPRPSSCQSLSPSAARFCRGLVTRLPSPAGEINQMCVV
jgi:hypothetical protein